MGRESSAVGHRHLGAAKGPLECPLEITMAGEPQPAALCVVEPQPLNGRRDIALRWPARHAG